MARAAMDSQGLVVITFDSRTETLPAPSEDGAPRIYLPCSECLTLTTVPPHITKVVCRQCNGRAGRLADMCAQLCNCERCARPREVFGSRA